MKLKHGESCCSLFIIATFEVSFQITITAQIMQEQGFQVTLIFPYKDKTGNSAPKRGKYASAKTRILAYLLCQFLWNLCELANRFFFKFFLSRVSRTIKTGTSRLNHSIPVLHIVQKPIIWFVKPYSRCCSEDKKFARSITCYQRFSGPVSNRKFYAYLLRSTQLQRISCKKVFLKRYWSLSL